MVRFSENLSEIPTLFTVSGKEFGPAGVTEAAKLAESEKFEINSVAAGRRPFIFPPPAPPWHPKCGVI
jgi:hypothetical protein